LAVQVSRGTESPPQPAEEHHVPAQIGAGLHDRFVAMRDAGLLASPDQPAKMIADLVTGDTTGQIAGAGTPATIST
jgi:hypothetical protein